MPGSVTTSVLRTTPTCDQSKRWVLAADSSGGGIWAERERGRGWQREREGERERVAERERERVREKKK